MDKRIPVIHLKTNKIYYVQGVVINATNTEDGQRMILYSDETGHNFVREEKEFRLKFKEI